MCDGLLVVCDCIVFDVCLLWDFLCVEYVILMFVFKKCENEMLYGL